MAEVRQTSRPRLGAHARLQWDPVREKQVLLAPERVLVLNETAAAILARCDGRRSVSAIAADLAAQYGRPVADDVLTLLNRLADKGFLEVDDHA
jgi:pyrroloquinoline quinone biosynthesis protein D